MTDTTTTRTAAKHPPQTITRADLDRSFAESFYGVPLLRIGEDGDLIMALGHHEPRRFLAAMLAWARSEGYSPHEWHLGEIRLDAAFAEKAAGWHVFYTHADAATADNPDRDPGDWCVCDEGPGAWYATQATGEGGGALPTMTWWAA